MCARDLIVLGLSQDRDPPGGPQSPPTDDLGPSFLPWHLTVLRWWRPA